MKVLGHEETKDTIKKFLNKKYNSYSFLFEGKDCIGKKLIALYTARAFLCEKGYDFGCGSCKDCRLVNNLIDSIYEKKEDENVHPNVKLVRAEDGKNIKIDQIREIISFLKLKSEKGKVVIIEKAEKMNTEAANALLKTLEEPPDNSMIILTTSNQNNLLPTIVSRCKKIKFKPLSKETVKEILELKGVDETKAKNFASISDGSLCLPMSILEKENLYKYGKDLTNLLFLFIQGKGVHPEGIVSISDILDKLEVEDLILIMDIVEMFSYRKAIKGEMPVSKYEKIVNESKKFKEAIKKGVKKKLAVEGFYFNVTN